MKANRTDVIGVVAAAVVFSLAQGASALNTVNLTTSGSSGTINGAFFTTTDSQSTGTGLIHSFVRLEKKGSEEGYNADARPVMPDVNTSPSFTRDLPLAAVPIVVNPAGGPAGSFYEFLLDINQKSSSPLLSLDQLQIYKASSPLSSASTLTDLTGSATLGYNMDGAPAGDSEILLDYNLNSGSGSGDLFAYIPVADLAGAKYVYLYSQFGAKGGDYAANDGFEEWAVRTSSTLLPDGGTTVLLLGVGLACVAAFAWRSRRAVA